MRPRLLIVEDDASLREVWEVVFGTRGWDVASASTVAEGLVLCMRTRVRDAHKTLPRKP